MKLLIRPGILFLVPPRHSEPLRTILTGGWLIKDVRNGGTGYVAGTAGGIVTVDGRPASRRILCLRRDNFHLVRDTWSKEDGTYLIPHLDPKLDYIVMAVDHEARWEPVAWDWVKPADSAPSP
nr:MAG TPA: hypothetical protein [Caudoviricetes sp.]